MDTKEGISLYIIFIIIENFYLFYK